MREALQEIIPGLRESSVQPDVAFKKQQRMDENIESKISRLMDLIDSRMTVVYPDALLRRWAMGMIGQTNKHTKKTVDKMIASGLEKKTDLIPFMKDDELHPFYRQVADENVGLIKSIAKNHLEAFKNQLVAMISQDMPIAQIQKAIQKNFALTKNRAALIAADQVGKLNGKLEQFRQQQIGLKRYEWVTSRDGRVRHDHKILNGKIFSWTKPPVINQKTGVRGHPKQDFRCRCWAKPVLSDLIDD